MPHKLLLADDSITIQRVIELTFAEEDIQVIAVGDGGQAIAWLEQERPDIVLADVGMPERDGYEVAAFIKGRQDLAHIPVLLLTGAFEPVDDNRARAAGCDGVLVKPFEPQMVINRVKELLAGRREAAGAPAPAVAEPPPAAPPVLAPPAEAGPPAPSASLEDYFDRLDAAFASLEGGSPPPAPAAVTPSVYQAPPMDITAGEARPRADRSGDDALGGWDPHLAGDPARSAPFEPPREDRPPAPPQPPLAAPVQAPAAFTPPAAAPGTPVAEGGSLEIVPAGASMPSLTEAFAALLGAEQGQHFAPSTVSPALHVPEPVIDDIVRRVIARMGDQAMRDAVLETAERIVREEIARIKARQV